MGSETSPSLRCKLLTEFIKPSAGVKKNVRPNMLVRYTYKHKVHATSHMIIKIYYIELSSDPVQEYIYMFGTEKSDKCH